MLHTVTTYPASNSPLYLPYPLSIIFVQDPKGAAYTDYRPSEQQSSLPSLSSEYHFCTRSKGCCILLLHTQRATVLFTFPILFVSFLYKIQRVLHTLTTYPASNSPLYLLYPVRIIFVQYSKGAAYSDIRPSEHGPLCLPYPVSIIFNMIQKGAAYSDYKPSKQQTSISSLSC